MIRVNGDNTIAEMDDWEWIQTADWIVVTKKDNRLLFQFNEWQRLPNRKELEKKMNRANKILSDVTVHMKYAKYEEEKQEEKHGKKYVREINKCILKHILI